MAVRPASVSMLIDNKEPVSVGKMCVERAAKGSDGKLRVAVCVLWITCCPLGRDADRYPIGGGLDVQQHGCIGERYEVSSGAGISINRMGRYKRRKLVVGKTFVNKVLFK